MSWISSTLRSAADDVRRRVDQAESDAHAAVDRAKQAASSAVDAARSRAASPTVPPAPTRAAEKQSSDASVAFAKNAVANLALQRAGTLKVPTPQDIPSLIPNKDEPGSTADKARKYVMLGAGVATGFASSHLGPSGALAQGVIDASIATFGSAEDKTNFGWGQVGGSSIAMLHGAMLDAEGGTIEVATVGGGSAVGLPAIAVGTIQMATAGANIATGMALISSGSPSAPAPALESSAAAHDPGPSAAPSESEGSSVKPSASSAPSAEPSSPASVSGRVRSRKSELAV